MEGCLERKTIPPFDRDRQEASVPPAADARCDENIPSALAHALLAVTAPRSSKLLSAVLCLLQNGSQPPPACSARLVNRSGCSTQLLSNDNTDLRGSQGDKGARQAFAISSG